MSTIQGFAIRNTNELHHPVCQKSKIAKHILDADCCYEDGVFALFSLPCKLPKVFTVRFTAPADFSQGNVFTLKGREFALKTRAMEAPEGMLFAAGAVVQCDIDMERDLAFFAAGGEQKQAMCDCRYQTGDLNFYIDLNGDDSPNNPGTVESPFRTLEGARNAVSQRYIFTSMGRLIYNINPGTYELDAKNRDAVCNATHPQEIVFQASDPNAKPLLVADRFRSERGHRSYNNLCLTATTNYLLHSSNNAVIFVRDAKLIARVPNTMFIRTNIGGVMRLGGSLILDGGGNAADFALSCYTGQIWSSGITVKIQNLPSVGIFAVCQQGNLHAPGMVFTGATAGVRYSVSPGGAIYTAGGGANYFPGTIAGTVSTNGVYA